METRRLGLGVVSWMTVHSRQQRLSVWCCLGSLPMRLAVTYVCHQQQPQLSSIGVDGNYPGEVIPC